jgi:hypothetical protein
MNADSSQPTPARIASQQHRRTLPSRSRDRCVAEAAFDTPVEDST